MFSYYGSKSKVIRFYPKPKFRRIKEPFAGSARYSLQYFDNEVLLMDLDQNIISLWNYLKKCNEKDIMGLPEFKTGDDIRNFNLSEEEKLFCGYLIGKGLSRPQNIVTPFAGERQPTWIPWQKRKIAKQLFKIKHWEIQLGHYSQLQNDKCTWFIDPPYQFGGSHYTKSNKAIDFAALAQWCRTRQGQVIVCENTKADWMDFKPMVSQRGSLHTTTEAIWYNGRSSFDYQPPNIFDFTKDSNGK